MEVIMVALNTLNALSGINGSDDTSGTKGSTTDGFNVTEDFHSTKVP
jgi:hypothetical protein